ncbi:MAG: FAD:protein FMN transferase [Dehalococcoidia bacterium]|nr:FAD:protein FMN transferase [Dehalococcoidia bacterium]
MQHSDSFRAMDTGIDVIVEAPGPFPPFGLFAGIHVLFEQQEERFSRFQPGSLLSRLNRGEAIDDPFFAHACALALEAFAFTGGLFHPLVLPALRQAGYGVTFANVAGGDPRAMAVPSPRDAIAIEGTTVRLLAGELDLGGIVKGWSVDLAAGMAANAGVAALVNAGGDLHAVGTEESAHDGWLVGIDGLDGQSAWEGEVAGALATSTTLKRAWRTSSGGRAHHLIDPRTGLPAESPFVQVSAWAPETWRAECWAKAVLIGGDAAAERALAAGVPILALDAKGRVRISR